MLDDVSVTGTAQEEQIPQDDVTVEEPTDSIVEEEAPVEEEEVNIDPGQLEGMGEQAKEHEPPPDHPRFKEVYGKMKDGERQVESLTKEMEELKRKLNETPVQQLAQPSAQVQPVTPPTEESKPDVESIELKAELKALRIERKQARKDYDEDKADELDDKIDDVKERLMLLRFNDKQTINPNDITQAMQQAQVKAAADNFSKKNSWFAPQKVDGTPNPDYNPIKSGAALALEQSLRKTWQGTYDELLSEVEQKIETTFNPQGQVVKPRASAVQGVTQIRQVDNGKVITLTEQQKKVARGIYPESKNPEAEYINLMKQQGAI